MSSKTTTEATPAAKKSGSTKAPKNAKAPNSEQEAAVASATSDPAPEPASGDERAPASVSEAMPAPEAAEPAPKRKGKEKDKQKAKPAPGEPKAGTLQAAFEGYLKRIEDEGKSDTTIRSYKADLAIALGELGAETPVASITQAQVEKYFACKRVTKTRAGKAKSPITVAKIRRTFRQAMEFAEGAGLLPKSPIPEETSH